MRLSVSVITTSLLLAISCAWAESGPVLSDTGYAADAYGAQEHYPLPEPGKMRTQKQFVGYYSHFDQIVPRDWLLQSTTVVSPTSFLAPGHATPAFGYGNQVWILPGERRVFALMGMDGQRIIVDPRSKMVLVQTAVWTNDHDPDMLEVFALWNALLAQYG